MEYQEQDIVRIAQRENNKKRNYLVVNRLQGKHIPVQPGKALEMFDTLAQRLKQPFSGKRLLVIGFAETATAIGAAVAIQLDAYYIQTTRENIEGVHYLYFSEDHSHATEQKLVKEDLDTIIPQVNQVLFVEDEVTTGNTILHIINLLEEKYPNQAAYAVASILNGMGEASLEVYRNRQIGLYYLVKTNQETYPEQARQFSKKGMSVPCVQQEETVIAERALRTKEYGEVADQKTAFADEWRMTDRIELGGWVDARRLVAARRYEQACMHLWEKIDACLHQELQGSVLVLGTEEFMYPALLVANQIERQERIEQNKGNVWFHATTRSPIQVYQEEQYPLHVRYELQSLYDKNRRTYVYDLNAYDTVLIITDAHKEETEGMESLFKAVARKNKKIYFICWKDLRVSV